MQYRKLNKTMPVELGDKFKILGSDFSAARRARKISQESLANRLNVGRRTIIRMEAGDHRVSMGVYVGTAWIMGLEANILDALKPENDVVQVREARLNMASRVDSPRVKHTDNQTNIVPKSVNANDVSLDF